MQQRIRVALIEDDEGLNEAMVLLLESAGYEVKTYLTISAFNRAQDPPPDLYLIDRHLEQEDGLDLCRAIKADLPTRNLPVVIMSANDDVRGLSAAAGADAFLAKPFTKSQLQAALQQVNGA
jgi:CheY-like chemotaxis protein